MLQSDEARLQDSPSSLTRDTTLLRILEGQSFDILASARARLEGQITQREYGDQIGLFLNAYGEVLDVH